MARAFSDRERGVIDEKLKAEATARFGLGGCRKTTVDELAAAAGISKGAFYLFYPSKEALFYRVLMDYQDGVRKDLLEKLDAKTAAAGGGTPEILAEVLTETFLGVGASFFPETLRNGELEYLSSRIDEETLAAHFDGDTDFFAAALSRIPDVKEADVAFWGAALRGLFTLLLHRREIGEEYFDRVVGTLVGNTVFAMAANGEARA